MDEDSIQAQVDELFSDEGMVKHLKGSFERYAFQLQTVLKLSQENRESALATMALEMHTDIWIVLGLLGLPDAQVAATLPPDPLFALVAPYRHDVAKKLR